MCNLTGLVDDDQLSQTLHVKQHTRLDIKPCSGKANNCIRLMNQTICWILPPVDRSELLFFRVLTVQYHERSTACHKRMAKMWAADALRGPIYSLLVMSQLTLFHIMNLYHLSKKNLIFVVYLTQISKSIKMTLHIAWSVLTPSSSDMENDKREIYRWNLDVA